MMDHNGSEYQWIGLRIILTYSNKTPPIFHDFHGKIHGFWFRFSQKNQSIGHIQSLGPRHYDHVIHWVVLAVGRLARDPSRDIMQSNLSRNTSQK